MNKITEDIGYTKEKPERPNIPDATTVISRVHKRPRDPHVSPLLEEYLEKKGWPLPPGVVPWPKEKR